MFPCLPLSSMSEYRFDALRDGLPPHAKDPTCGSSFPFDILIGHPDHPHDVQTGGVASRLVAPRLAPAVLLLSSLEAAYSVVPQRSNQFARHSQSRSAHQVMSLSETIKPKKKTSTSQLESAFILPTRFRSSRACFVDEFLSDPQPVVPPEGNTDSRMQATPIAQNHRLHLRSGRPVRKTCTSHNRQQLLSTLNKFTRAQTQQVPTSITSNLSLVFACSIGYSNGFREETFKLSRCSSS